MGNLGSFAQACPFCDRASQKRSFHSQDNSSRRSYTQ
jgi:hypothetical protein